MARAGRIIRRVIAYGVIGLIVNVLVAWGFAAGGGANDLHWSSPTPSADSDDVVEWGRVVPIGTPDRPTLRLVAVGRGLRADVRRAIADLGTTFIEYRIGSGFPSPALEWSGFRATAVNGAATDIVDQPMIRLPRLWPEVEFGGWLGVPRGLPLRPAWGMLTNTVVYALAWWTVRVVSDRIRGIARRRRGLCPSCAYDLRGNFTPGCPECGWGRAGPTP